MSAEPVRNNFRASVLRGEKPPLVVTDKNRRLEGEDALDGRLVSRSETRSSNHRQKDRHRLTGETATVLYADRAFDIEVINLSAGGAMIRGSFEPKLWDILELQLGDGFAIEAAVRWLKGDQIGLEFAHETRIECGAAERAALLLEVIRKSFDDQDVRLTTEEQDEIAAAEPEDDLGKRDEKRHPLIWMGEIHYAHDSNPVRLRNVSEGGALIDVAVDYPLGVEVMLDLREAGQFFATVVWACGDQTGLRFQRPFDIACLAKARPHVTPHYWNLPDFLGRQSDEDSPWNENWTRSSIEEIRNDLESYLKR
jgi:hypothetical protein